MIKSKKKFRTTQDNDNENMTIQNLWDTVKAVFRGKSIMIQVFLIKKKRKKERKKEKKISNKQSNLLLKRIRKKQKQNLKPADGRN